MFPKHHKDSFIFNYSKQCANHALPYTGQISQTENIMELCWCGQKMSLWKNKINFKMGSGSPVSSLPSPHYHLILSSSSVLCPHELLNQKTVIIHIKHAKILEIIAHVTMCHQFYVLATYQALLSLP